MKIHPTDLPDVLLIEPRVFRDDRGFFYEAFNADVFAEHAADGLPTRFLQDNHSRSTERVLRGLHYQWRPGQGKLVGVVRGRIWDVVVDLRPDSPTYRQWVGVELTAENRRMVYVPAGFAHGFCVLSETADIFYKCTDFYFPEHERTLLWNDPALAIPWPFATPILSDKDARLPLLSQCTRLPRHRDS